MGFLLYLLANRAKKGAKREYFVLWQRTMAETNFRVSTMTTAEILTNFLFLLCVFLWRKCPIIFLSSASLQDFKDGQQTRKTDIDWWPPCHHWQFYGFCTIFALAEKSHKLLWKTRISKVIDNFVASFFCFESSRKSLNPFFKKSPVGKMNIVFVLINPSLRAYKEENPEPLEVAGEKNPDNFENKTRMRD